MKLLFDENSLTAVITKLTSGEFRAHIPEIDGLDAIGKTEAIAEENLIKKLDLIKDMAKGSLIKRK